MDAASIDEINRLRVSMGMKPLPGGGESSKPREPAAPEGDGEAPSTVESRQAEAYDNFKKAQAAQAAKKLREEKAAAIKRAREKAQRFAVLEGKGLGDLDDEDEGGARAWLKGRKKRQGRIDQAREEEEAKDAAAAAAAKAREYTSKDLAGVRVGHDMSTLDGDDNQILTLKDNTVLDDEDEGDELENLNLRELEKLNERLELKKKKFVYDPNDFDDTGERGILAQYDEEISGKKRKQFRLDLQGAAADILDDVIDVPAGQKEKKKKLEGVSLDIMQEDAPASDYLDMSEIKVKKPKKKKSRSARKRPVDDDDILFDAEQQPADAEDQSMDMDSGAASFKKKRKAVDEAFVDDEDLQASLALQRSAALKKRKRVRPEDLARQLREEATQTPERENEETPNGGLVLDEITEFVGALKKPDEDEDRKHRSKPRNEEAAAIAMDEDSDEDVEMEGATVVKKESDEAETEEAGLATAGVDEEKTIGQGMGAALGLLRERGLVKESGGVDLNAAFRDHEKFLAEKKRRLAKVEEEARLQRERDRASGHLDRMSVREREEYSRKQNERREFQASRVMQEMFNDGYKPNFDLRYTDDLGRLLDRKEAFKHLSHQFHGKGSGKGKTDKRLKKIEDEKRREAQSMLDASQHVGMSSATAQQTKKRREAGVRLA